VTDARATWNVADAGVPHVHSPETVPSPRATQICCAAGAADVGLTQIEIVWRIESLKRPLFAYSRKFEVLAEL